MALGGADHVIVFNESGLRWLMTPYCSYYERSRAHLSLGEDTPIPRPVTRLVLATSWRSPRSVASINEWTPRTAFGSPVSVC